MNSCKYTWIVIFIPLTTCKNEKYFYDHYNEFEYNQDYVK